MVEKIAFDIRLHNHLNSILEKRDFLTYMLVLNFRGEQTYFVGESWLGAASENDRGKHSFLWCTAKLSTEAAKVNYFKHLELGHKWGGTSVLTRHML